MKKCDVFITPKNMKMTVPCWSLPAGKTCPGKTPLCEKHCYARKIERLRPPARARRAKNLVATRHADFVPVMAAWITTFQSPLFRIHEGGDFYDQAYLDNWFEICRLMPQVHFLAFTKAFAHDYSRKPVNLSVIWSVFPDTDLNTVPPEGPRAYAGDCGNIAALPCPGQCDNCLSCWNRPGNVHFNIH